MQRFQPSGRRIPVSAQSFCTPSAQVLRVWSGSGAAAGDGAGVVYGAGERLEQYAAGRYMEGGVVLCEARFYCNMFRLGVTGWTPWGLRSEEKKTIISAFRG